MSFQGDVRGLGLAELLQGLSRGRKEGILTLTSSNGSCTLGVEEGLVYLLPEPDEDAEEWRDRVRNAWSRHSDVRADYIRMQEIAKARRLERLFDLLDGDGVHFRFNPGELPNRSMGSEGDAEKTEVYCEGIAVEFLLLEYARMGDELASNSGAQRIDRGDIPLLLATPEQGDSRVLAECDGSSTVEEIADRLGWPVRQCQLSVWSGMNAGTLRLAHYEEILNLALNELVNRNYSRAALRLGAWCERGRPGPLTQYEIDAFSNEWMTGRLPTALRGMPARQVRTLLRRMDHSIGDPERSVTHWHEAVRLHPSNLLIRMHCLALEARLGADPNIPSLDELLDLARTLRDTDVPHRAGPMFVLAAHLQPSSELIQLEIGQGLVAAGRHDEGAPWIIAAAQALLSRGNADRVVVPLRQLLEADPGHRECRQLLTRARRSSTKTRKLRKQLLVGLTIAAVVSGVAFVRVRKQQLFEDALARVRAKMSDPNRALLELERSFEGDQTNEVLKLRGEIRDLRETIETEKRENWDEVFRDALASCSLGDPVEGLRKTLELPVPPKLSTITDPFPLQKDLYDALHESLAAKVQALGPPAEEAPQQVHREDELLTQFRAMTEMLDADEASAIDKTHFREQLGDLQEQIDARIRTRIEMIAQRVQTQNMQKQDLLLTHARAQAKNGEFQRSLRNYEELLRMDGDGRIREVLGPEMELVRDQERAVAEARELASQGEHTGAYELLADKFANPDQFVLPWKVESYPSGARVVLDDESFRTTPFIIETTFAERVSMRFELEGFDTIMIEVDEPSNQFVYLSRTPERFWSTPGRIDAMPVAVDDDHVLADRKGRIVRIGALGEVRWESEIPTLSGIARAPVFLPQRPGHMVLVTEDGSAWIVEADTGQLEGPWELSSAPTIGPYPTQNSVRVLLRNGSVASWKNRLKPTIQGQSGIGKELEDRFRYGSEAGLAVERRGASDGEPFEAPFNAWRVTIEDNGLYVDNPEEDTGYTIERDGQWVYLGWEAPRSNLRTGRLWVSDEFGLRAFVPE